MNDPVAELLNNLRNDKRLKCDAPGVTTSFLNNVADVFERYGFGATETYLRDKREQEQTSTNADILLDVLRHLRTCSIVHQERAIGRLVIKTLPQLFETEDKKT